MKQHYIIFILSTLFLFACSSGKKRLEQGDYDNAVYKAVNRLQQKPNHPKAVAVLKEAYTLAVDEHMARIRNLDNSDNPLKYGQMVREYEQISYLNNAIRRYPKYAKVVQLIDVQEELNFTKKRAAISFEKQGEELLALGTKSDARQAYKWFKDANSFVNNHISPKRLQETREAGTINVLLEFENDRRYFRDFNTDMVFNDLRNNFKGSQYTFMRVVDLGDSRFDIDEVVYVELDDAQISGVNFSERIKTVVKDNVHMGEAKTDSGEIVQVYGSVKAEYFEYRKTITSSAALMIERLDAVSNSVQRRQVFPSTYSWTEVWADYRGDERALSKEQLDLACKREPMPPNPQWLFAQASTPLVAQSCNFLREEFRHLR
jgi:hypothetical protein